LEQVRAENIVLRACVSLAIRQGFLDLLDMQMPAGRHPLPRLG
jgi:hypothetical protein